MRRSIVQQDFGQLEFSLKSLVCEWAARDWSPGGVLRVTIGNKPSTGDVTAKRVRIFEPGLGCIGQIRRRIGTQFACLNPLVPEGRDLAPIWLFGQNSKI